MVHRVRRLPLALVLVLVVASLGGMARPAGACTCAPFDTRAALAGSDAAFVGTVMSRTESPLTGTPAGGGEATYRFRVEQAVKGDLGDEVEVRSPAGEESCGLSAPAGRAVGLLLTERDGSYHGDLCRQPSPERLMRAAEPLPPPDGRLPPQLLVGSTYGNGRSLALDPEGRVAGIGFGPGGTQQVALCPDRNRVVELFATPSDGGPDTPGITVRLLATMETETERLLPGLLTAQAIALFCGDAEATEVVLVTRDEGAETGSGDTAEGSGAEQAQDPGAAETEDAPGRSRIVRVRPGGEEPAVLWEGGGARAAAFSVADRVAYLNLGREGEEVVAVPLDDPDGARTVTRVPAGSGRMVASPDGRYLASVAVGSSRPSQVVSVDLTVDPPAVSTADLGGAGVAGEVHWTADHIVFTPRLRPAEPVRIYDPSLTLLASWTGWVADHSVVIDETLFGVSQGAVRSASLTSGPPVPVRELEDALMVSVLDVSPPQTEREAPPTTTTTTTTAPPVAAPTTTTTTLASSSTSSSTTTTTRPDPTTTTPRRPPTTPPSRPELAERVSSKRDGDGGVPLLAGGAAALALVGTTVIVRRRRRRTAPPD